MPAMNGNSTLTGTAPRPEGVAMSHDMRSLGLRAAIFAILWLLALLVLVDRGILGNGFTGDPVVDRLLVALTTAGLIVLPVVSVWHLFQTNRTVIDADGVSQPGWQGTNRIRWRDATRVELTGGPTLRLRAPGRSVTIRLGTQRAPMKVLAFVFERLQANGRL